MYKKEFLRSEAARILSQYDRMDDPGIPSWITEEQKSQFKSLSEDEITEIFVRRTASMLFTNPKHER